jgi:hypothetical protein
MLAEFEQLGFEPIVGLSLKADRFAPDSFKWPDSAGWLYAIVSDGAVMYVGLTANVPRSRIDQYRHSVGQQGKRINQLVIVELAAGKRVQMFGLRAADRYERKREELRLRVEFKPPWNLI